MVHSYVKMARLPIPYQWPKLLPLSTNHHLYPSHSNPLYNLSFSTKVRKVSLSLESAYLSLSLSLFDFCLIYPVYDRSMVYPHSGPFAMTRLRDLVLPDVSTHFAFVYMNASKPLRTPHDFPVSRFRGSSTIDLNPPGDGN